MQGVRIVEITDQQMVSSQPGMFGDGKLETFMLWMDRQKKGIWPKDFLTDVPGTNQLRWLHLLEEGMDVPEELEVISFKGGLYAVAADRDRGTDYPVFLAEVKAGIAEMGFEMDEGRLQLGNVISPPAAQRAMGYCQMDYYFPVRPIGE